MAQAMLIRGATIYDGTGAEPHAWRCPDRRTA